MLLFIWFTFVHTAGDSPISGQLEGKYLTNGRLAESLLLKHLIQIERAVAFKRHTYKHPNSRLVHSPLFATMGHIFHNQKLLGDYIHPQGRAQLAHFKWFPGLCLPLDIAMLCSPQEIPYNDILHYVYKSRNRRQARIYHRGLTSLWPRVLARWYGLSEGSSIGKPSRKPC